MALSVLMRSFKKVEFVGPVSCPSSSVVVVMCHDDHRRWKVFWAIYDSWDFVPYLMRGGGTTRVGTTWHVLINGVNASIV